MTAGPRAYRLAACLGALAPLVMVPALATGQAAAGAASGAASPATFLERLAGEWSVVSEAMLGPDQDPIRGESREVSRLLGGRWLVAEGTRVMGGRELTSILTIGYDAHGGRFVATYIDEAQAHLWSYTGQLDDAGSVLTLETEGPVMGDPTRTARFRLAIEARGGDRRVMRSRILGPDGEWFEYGRAEYRRVESGEVSSTLAGVEARLLSASSVRLGFDVTAEGAFAASLQGSLELDRGGRAALDASGTFGGNPVVLRLVSDDGVMEGGNGDRTFREAAPAALAEALVIGLTRMGILHNLARLTAGATPDRAAGGVRDWVEARDVVAEGDALAFSVHVAGQRAGEATLRLDPGSGLPVAREQVVRFPSGEMRVTERYELVVVDG